MSSVPASDLRRALAKLSDAVLMHLHFMRLALQPPVGAGTAGVLERLMSGLELENDLARYTHLGARYGSDDKQAALQKILAGLGSKVGADVSLELVMDRELESARTRLRVVLQDRAAAGLSLGESDRALLNMLINEGVK